MGKFQIATDLRPMGDQPQAIAKLSEGILSGARAQTLLGVTGSGKTFTMAGVIERVQRPALVIAHNKTLAAQLATEFREFFPRNAVEYFVSYYDYYQPESYIPRTDTYIEKESDINNEINRLRLSTTNSLITRPDTLVVASVSCIYGLGSPAEYKRVIFTVAVGADVGLTNMSRRLTEMHYERSQSECSSGQFRVRGDLLEVMPSYSETIMRLQFWGDTIESITEVEPLTGEVLQRHTRLGLSPAKHFILPDEQFEDALKDIEDELAARLNQLRGESKLLEAQRLEQRTMFDLEMLRASGTCAGVENYSRPLGRRAPGSAPWTLLDYFPDDYLLFIDESHITLPQLRAMYRGDLSRKTTLVDYGFRLPSALDNRPLAFDEFEERLKQVVFVSATPSQYELDNSARLVEQIIRPTGLVDPLVSVEPTKNQIDDLLERVRGRIERGERALVTTLTKQMAERLTEYLIEIGVKAQYIHADIDTLERTEILRNLRLGVYDVVVGINLLREGLDLPEVSLVAILDADKEGYLRSETSLIQTIGRAARHLNGEVVMYADYVTKSMRRAIDETERRRAIQARFNAEHGIEPQSIVKEVRDITDRVRRMVGQADAVGEGTPEYDVTDLNKREGAKLVRDLEKQMKQAAKDLKFEQAAALRDQIRELRGAIGMMSELVGRG